jgi:hypothetical protein
MLAVDAGSIGIRRMRLQRFSDVIVRLFGVPIFEQARRGDEVVWLVAGKHQSIEAARYPGELHCQHDHRDGSRYQQRSLQELSVALLRVISLYGGLVMVLPRSFAWAYQVAFSTPAPRHDRILSSGSAVFGLPLRRFYASAEQRQQQGS